MPCPKQISDRPVVQKIHKRKSPYTNKRHSCEPTTGSAVQSDCRPVLPLSTNDSAHLTAGSASSSNIDSLISLPLTTFGGSQSIASANGSSSRRVVTKLGCRGKERTTHSIMLKPNKIQTFQKSLQPLSMQVNGLFVTHTQNDKPLFHSVLPILNGVQSTSSASCCIEDVVNAQTIHQSRRAPSNKRKALKNVPGRGKDVGVSTTESGCVSAVGPASIDYQETDMNNSEIGNGKRKRHPGQLPANKKQSIAISIADLFGDKSMEHEPAETALDGPQVSISHGQATVPVLPARTAFHNEQQRSLPSPIIKRKKKKANPLVYTPEELEQLDAAGLPEAKTEEQLDAIMTLFHAAVHEPDVICCVCDQFLRISESKLVPSGSLPLAFFEKLKKPTGVNGDAEVLHPRLLAQYDVSQYFPGEGNKFANLLLSPRGIEHHRLSCSALRGCDCQPYLRMCKDKCFACLKRGALPKFAIANGNWFGQLPDQLRSMTLGTRSLLRPVHNSGHLVAYSSKKFMGGTSITGHVYSNRLDTPLVRTNIPLQPSDVPVRVIVVSPFNKDETILLKAKIAAMQKNYIIDPDAIKQTLQFWKEVGNKVMAQVEFDQENYDRLPINEVSSAMFTMTSTEDAPPETDTTTEKVPMEPQSGGASLLRNNQEVNEVVITSATVTIGREIPSEESNVHQKVVAALSANKVLPPKETNSDIYVVRPDNSFVSDSDSNYLEIHYPDLLPFGRAGTNEKRRIKISRKALLAYMLNLSTRQFQEVDFVLPVYDMVTRHQVSTMGFVRSKIPSRSTNADGTLSSKAEAFGRVSIQDMESVCQHKIACAKTASRGGPLPPPPASSSGMAAEFFNDITIATKHNQHSLAAAADNRGGVYAAHHSLGKASIWFTFCPDDTQSFKILWYALGPEKSAIYKDQIPDGVIRFETLANHPAAGALNFERCLKIALEYVVGWDSDAGAPLKNRGVWGTPSGHLRIVEEQFRLTLHSHHLIWLHGHQNIEHQLKVAQHLSTAEVPRSYVSPSTDDGASTSTDIPSPCHPDRGPIANDLLQIPNPSNITSIMNQFQTLVQRLKKNIDTFAVGELALPATETETIVNCLDVNCPGRLQLNSNKMLMMMRRRPLVPATEASALRCDTCHSCHSISQAIDASLERGFQRCFGRPKLSPEEIQNLVWRQLRPKPPPTDEHDLDCWLLHLASIQLSVNMHDWKHRESCFKNGRKECRYKTPHLPVDEISVEPVFAVNLDTVSQKPLPTDPLNDPIVHLEIDLKKRTPFLFLTDCNIYALAVFNCNNCTRYVDNQKVSLYYGAYASKHSTENEKALAEMLRALSAYEEKIENRKLLAHNSTETVSPVTLPPTTASIGLGRLLSASRAATNGETVGALLAAFAARGNLLFDMSHKTAVLPLTQTLAFLQAQPMRTIINNKGQVFSVVYDYVYRNHSFEDMNFWTFVATQKIVPRKDNTDPTSADGLNSSPSVDLTLPRWQKHQFVAGHPNRETHCHQERPRACWPVYRAKRLPDFLELDIEEPTLNVSPEDQQREAKRELYAQGALIMFKPFRTLADLCEESDPHWWSAYLRYRPSLETDCRSTTILGNMQNYYESFCRSGKESCEPEFPNDVNLLGQRQEQPEDEERSFALDLLEAEQEMSAAETTENAQSVVNPLTAKLATMHPSLFQLTPPSSAGGRVTVEQAKMAVSQLPKKKTPGSFALPGRQSADLSSTQTQPNATAQNQARLDYVIGSRVDLLSEIENALLEASYVVCPSLSGTAPTLLAADFPTIGQHSRHWTLNAKQHMAFVLIAAALLKHISEANRPDHSNVAAQLGRLSSNIDALLRGILPPSGQLVLYLGGAGGTGKSRVIQAFVDFARRWHSMSNHVICASSGVAAILIGGCTLHTALGIGVEPNPPEPNNNHIQAWSEIGVMFLDEFSMIRPALYSLTNSRLQKMKARLDKPFGGVHLVFCGDFYQLQPIGSFIFQTPTQFENAKDSNAIESMRGRHLWRTQLTDVIELTENHRQTADPLWAASLERWRINQPTQEDIEAVNSRFVDDLNPDLQRPPPQTIIAVCQNNHRETGMRYFEKRTNDAAGTICAGDTDWKKRGILLVKARITQAKGHQQVRRQQEDYIRGLNEQRLGCTGNLVCILGAPYMVTINTDVSKQVANGTMCHLQDIILEEGASITVELTEHGSQMHSVYSNDIVCLVFHHRLAEFKCTDNFGSLPPGCFPVVPKNRNIRCKLGLTSNVFSVSITQFPCTLANMITGHKVQGQSLDSIILGTLSPVHQYGTTGWIYVILSRVRTLSGLFLLTKLCTDIKKYKPRWSVMTEMKRLRDIEQSTLSRLYVIEQGTNLFRNPCLG